MRVDTTPTPPENRTVRRAPSATTGLALRATTITATGAPVPGWLGP
jgi:hypothetical protein